jgi:hypothetical protein
VLPKDYARPALDKTRLGQLIDVISNIMIGDEASRSKDVLGRVYEYFLSQFASAEGKKGGEFYTPRCVVKLLVEMLEPYRGRLPQKASSTSSRPQVCRSQTFQSFRRNSWPRSTGCLSATSRWSYCRSCSGENWPYADARTWFGRVRSLKCSSRPSAVTRTALSKRRR